MKRDVHSALTWGAGVCLLLATGCPGEAKVGKEASGPAGTPSAAADDEESVAFKAQSTEFEDWYPATIQAPEGTEYPCALTALPKDLTGIPEAERRFVNHVYTCLFDSIQAKQVILSALANGESGLDGKLESYLAATGEAVKKIGAELAPAELRPFRTKVIEAIELQQAFFTEAVKQAGEGVALKQIYTIPAGKQASSKLLAAWGDMARRYPSWGPEVKDSVYHHLCALDLF